jgi:serine protease Do
MPLEQIIKDYRDRVVQISTAQGVGTGYLLPIPGLIATNWHVLDQSLQVVIEGEHLPRQVAQLVYLDEALDLAFIAIEPTEPWHCVELLEKAIDVAIGEEVLAIGHPYGLEYTATRGIVSNLEYVHNQLHFYQHDAALNPGNSGGPLMGHDGRLIGMNTFIMRDGNRMGFALPIKHVTESLQLFENTEFSESARCSSCRNVVVQQKTKKNHCPHCGDAIQLPSDLTIYQPEGIPRVLEFVLHQIGQQVMLARRGPNAWEIYRGSATVSITYHKDSGLISGDALLCNLPESHLAEFYTFILKQNYNLKGLTLSVRGQDVLLTLLIKDNFLNTDTGIRLFNQLLEQADILDNQLVEQFGARWSINHNPKP